MHLILVILWILDMHLHRISELTSFLCRASEDTGTQNRDRSLIQDNIVVSQLQLLCIYILQSGKPITTSKWDRRA